MSSPEGKLGMEGEQENPVLDAFKRLERLYELMDVEEENEFVGRRTGSCADGSRYRVERFFRPDNYSSGPKIRELSVKVIEREYVTLGFVANSNGLKSLYMPGVDVLVGNFRASGLKKPFEIKWNDSEFPEEARREFRALSVPLVDRFSENVSAQTPYQMKPYVMITPRSIKSERRVDCHRPEIHPNPPLKRREFLPLLKGG